MALTTLSGTLAGPVGLATALLPVLQGIKADSEGPSKLRLAEIQFGADGHD